MNLSTIEVVSSCCGAEIKNKTFGDETLTFCRKCGGECSLDEMDWETRRGWSNPQRSITTAKTSAVYKHI